MIAQSGAYEPDEIERVFRRVLEDPDFATQSESVLLRAFTLLFDLLEALFERWFPGLEDSQVQVVSMVVLGGAACLAALAVFRWARDRRPSARSRAPAAGDAAKSVEPADRRRRSKRLAGEDRVREAATELYQAVVFHLDRAGALRYGGWKTPYDYLQEVPSDSSLRTAFRTFLAGFVEVAFGSREPTREDFERLDASAERLGCPG